MRPSLTGRHTGKSFATNCSSDTPSAGLSGIRSGRRLADRSSQTPGVVAPSMHICTHSSCPRGHFTSSELHQHILDAVDSLLSSASDSLTSSAPSASSKAVAHVSSRPEPSAIPAGSVPNMRSVSLLQLNLGLFSFANVSLLSDHASS